MTVAAPAPAERQIRSILVKGSQRLEPETIRAYANLSPGQTYTAQTLDQALKDLYATQLFADVQITGADTGDLVIAVRENPVINRIILEGNKRLKDDKITPEIKLAPRQIFTRSAARADVDRILELYRRQGRFAARVEPKIVQLDQNRVDVVFEIYEGDLAKVRAINILGNTHYPDGRLRKEMYTRQTGGLLGFMKSNDTYDPDRLAADQQKLRAFYLTQGYADFRVVQALAELTPDRRDFVITYVVEEGPRYKFGTVEADSALRDFPNSEVLAKAKIQPGAWFNAKQVEDAVTNLNEAAGNLGYAFADISPAYNRDAEKRVMNLTIKVAPTPRVYVERIDITGNTATRDKVIRREFRLNEGDAFSALRVKRSQDRIQSLGFFQEKLEIKQTEGSAPDRVVLGVNVEEKPTGQLSLSGGYSSLERFVVQLAVSQNNFMGKGQSLDASLNWSQYSKSVELGFTDPYFLDKSIIVGANLFRRDYRSFNFIGNNRNTTYSQTSTGGALRFGFPITEYWSFGGRYSLSNDKLSLDKNTFYTNGTCNPDLAGRYLCDEIGTRLTSLIGVSTIYDDTDGLHPTRGQRLSLSQDFAGLGGDVRYLRSRVDATKYRSIGGGWVVSLHGEGGFIAPLQKSPGPGRDAIRLTDRFFDPGLRGFDIRGIGPRIQRRNYTCTDSTTNADQTVTCNAVGFTDAKAITTDAIGGRAYYMGRLELEFPVSSGLKSLGLRPSAFVDVGSLWKVTQPNLSDYTTICSRAATETVPADEIRLAPGQGINCPTGYARIDGYKEFFLGNSPKPRLTIGVGVNWVSPFGPLRIDIAKALLKQPGDDTKLFSFNVGTQF
ncbi:outer membrane protein assembly factor BamA [Sphingomonas flavescens]|jgi:outer membrane protein insertion porin family|uniref:outer membrane protein assembly factor BamA n=1 Tax=Sphingomonas flavescens TaxID=3132797 RepID=UPI0028047067|nr:outer membrane protein assembly factor BamA [Sphingomonas limnosediminicola]